MGKKKDKKERKIKGAEKTLMKTERNFEKKMKRRIQEKGEQDIEALLDEYQEQGKKRQEVVEEKINSPSPRCNMSLTPHPDKDFLIMFGGEFYNGSKTFVYNDLLMYNIKTAEWMQVRAPNTPAPRCSHQAVALAQGGGELWIFGGEFASPSESQFHHYRDLWLLKLKDYTWTKISVSGGPSARSGHRMIAVKKLLVVFGGYHDNLRNYTYYNDVHVFDTSICQWIKIDISGTAPCPRSGCVMAITQDHGQIVIYGGYSKEKLKKDVDRGHIHTDMFVLETKMKLESDAPKWKWTAVKQAGSRPSPRCSSSLVVTGPNRAMLFGGVFDEEDDETVKGVFFNDIYTLEVDKARWHRTFIQKRHDVQRKRRRKNQNAVTDGSNAELEDLANDVSGSDSDNADDAMCAIDEEVKKMKVDEIDRLCAPGGEASTSSKITTFDDGIFTVTVDGVSSSSSLGMDKAPVGATSTIHMDALNPCPRMNAALAVKQGRLFLFGGLVEEEDKQLTLSDFYSLDIHKLDEWQTIVSLDKTKMEWHESGSSSDDDDDDDDEHDGATGGNNVDMESDDDDDDDDDEESSEDSSDDVCDVGPSIKAGETCKDYYVRTEDVWMQKATEVAIKEKIQATEKQMKKAAANMSKEFWQQNMKTT